MSPVFNHYDPEVAQFRDEYFQSDGALIGDLSSLVDDINQVGWPELRKRQAHAESALMKMGITFTVYGDTKGTERIFPFDVIPRVIVKNEWQELERGLRQRSEALNLFIADVYGDQRFIKEGHMPKELVLANPAYRPQCQGMRPP